MQVAPYVLIAPIPRAVGGENDGVVARGAAGSTEGGQRIDHTLLPVAALATCQSRPADALRGFRLGRLWPFRPTSSAGFVAVAAADAAVVAAAAAAEVSAAAVVAALLPLLLAGQGPGTNSKLFGRWPQFARVAALYARRSRAACARTRHS